MFNCYDLYVSFLLYSTLISLSVVALNKNQLLLLLLSLTRLRDRLKRKADKSKRLLDYKYYRGVQNHLNNLRTILKKMYYETAVRENRTNPWKLWKLLKSYNANDKSVFIMKSYTGFEDQWSFEADKSVIVNELNNHFVSIGVKVKNKSKNDSQSVHGDVVDIFIHYLPDLCLMK